MNSEGNIPPVGSLWYTPRGEPGDIVIWLVVDNSFDCMADYIRCQWTIPSMSKTGFDYLKLMSFASPSLRRLRSNDET